MRAGIDLHGLQQSIYTDSKWLEFILGQLIDNSIKYGEEGKVTVRSIRRDTIEKYKTMKKNSEITEDDMKSCEKKVQDLTDKFCEDIDKSVAAKEKEIMTV